MPLFPQVQIIERNFKMKFGGVYHISFGSIFIKFHDHVIND
jgi:hypothetical protein